LTRAPRTVIASSVMFHFDAGAHSRESGALAKHT
jgi:hypothetical protein